MLMQNRTMDDLAATVQKIKFGTRKDYWNFVSYFAASRVQAYIDVWAAVEEFPAVADVPLPVPPSSVTTQAPPSS